jgi:hypothetical protein
MTTMGLLGIMQNLTDFHISGKLYNVKENLRAK